MNPELPPGPYQLLPLYNNKGVYYTPTWVRLEILTLISNATCDEATSGGSSKGLGSLCDSGKLDWVHGEGVAGISHHGAGAEPC